MVPMKQSILTLPFLLMLVVVPSCLSAQSLEYEAFFNDEKVGGLQIEREISDEREKIWTKGRYTLTLDSVVTVKFESLSTYMDGRLKESESSVQVNEGEEFTISIWRKDGHYAIRKSSLDFAFPILVEEVFGLDLLMYEEPKQIRHAYSLQSGDPLWIELTGASNYRLKRINPDRTDDDLFVEPFYNYRYKNGRLTSFNQSYQGLLMIFKLIKGANN